MFITVAQVIIAICVVLFMLFHLISVYFHQETYTFSKIKISDHETAWKILNDLAKDSKWWSKFDNINNVESKINIIENYPNIRLKLMFREIKSQDEIWTFLFDNASTGNYLLIKKQTLTHSRFKDFLNKYYRNNQDIKKLVNNLEEKIRYIKNNALM